MPTPPDFPSSPSCSGLHNKVRGLAVIGLALVVVGRNWTENRRAQAG
jgi:hypothetical protein